jgi:ribulose kinase
MRNYYIGIDVGTGSARAALVEQDGKLVASSTEETTTFRDHQDHRIFEQSTNEIWSAIGKTIKDVLAQANVSASNVKGIGFDATCSLAVTDMNVDPVVVTNGDNIGQIGDRNIILWADHRAEKEAELINSTGSVVLDYVGGVMSVRPALLSPNYHSPMSLISVCTSWRWKSPRSCGSKNE